MLDLDCSQNQMNQTDKRRIEAAIKLIPVEHHTNPRISGRSAMTVAQSSAQKYADAWFERFNNAHNIIMVSG